jgi:U3 small nucleolar RNA-associated protein 25
MHRLYMMHLLNHVLTSRSRIQRHNRQLKDIEKEEDGAMQDDNDGRFRDQGFTRPTVLVLIPTKSACYQFVQDLFKLTGNEFDNGHNERFETEYGDADDDESSSERRSGRRKAVLEKKGKEWNELFGDTVNKDDDFKLGISLTPKAAKAKTEKKKSSNVGIKLYSDFYKGDIIVASPLGLKLLIAPDEEEEEGDYDYLSSIEICLVQYSDVLLMQNWDHVNDILALLNQEPQKNNNSDFSRVRNYLLEGQGDRWRQLIISSKVMDPFLSSSFKRFGKSLTGNVRMRWQIDPENASIANVLIPIKQVFQKVPAASFEKQSECRVNYFVQSILPQILRHKQKQTMIYVPSYFDFCSLRNVLLKREISFVSVHEYSRTSEVTRGRARFLQGRKPIMLYTGRCNFFHRHSIKGARHLIFLGLPEHPEFYSDHVNQIMTTRDDSDMEAATSVSSCLVLCTRFEALALERIVGSSNCARMLKSEKSTFMFYS